MADVVSLRAPDGRVVEVVDNPLLVTRLRFGAGYRLVSEFEVELPESGEEPEPAAAPEPEPVEPVSTWTFHADDQP